MAEDTKTTTKASSKAAAPKKGFGGVAVGEQVPLHEANKPFQGMKADRARHSMHNMVARKPLRAPLDG